MLSFGPFVNWAKAGIRYFQNSSSKRNDVVLVSAVRTPIGSFGGSLSTQSAIQLGSIAVKAAVSRAGIDPLSVNEIILGNVCQANVGQSPARQVQLAAGLANSIDATTINKVCASGLKAIHYGMQSIQLGYSSVVVAGGFESMSNVPYYIQGVRFGGLKFGNSTLVDGLVRDGLSDAYDGSAMGCASDNTARVQGLSREDQDEYALSSYKRAQEALQQGYFKDEITEIVIPPIKRGESKRTVVEDEEINKVLLDKVRHLKPAFSGDGTATAANSSKLNDGSSALVLMSAQRASELGLRPIARILGYADAATDPIDFTIAPSISLPRAISLAGLEKDCIDYWEINEAFSTVALANMRILDIPHQKLNVRGGAVALGHAIGSSGSRIVVTLAHILQQSGKRYGAAAICNGGGGSSAIVIERL